MRTRASVVPIEEVFRPRDFEAQNDLYIEIARTAGIDLARRALAAAELAPAQVDLVVSVSCTGFMIPAVDAYVADALGMGPRLARLPITESGCAGGVVGLARALDFLTAHPDRAALVLAVEFASLTFQRGTGPRPTSSPRPSSATAGRRWSWWEPRIPAPVPRPRAWWRRRASSSPPPPT